MRLLIAACLLVSAPVLAQRHQIIIDTDAGSDDLMAIAFLLSRSDVKIEAITTAYGLAHVDRGAENLVRLLELGGQPDVPVYIGRSEPLEATAPFPAEWRKFSDDLPGVTLPKTKRNPQTKNAESYMKDRLREPHAPATILALGALTNLAQVFQGTSGGVMAIREIIIMGGAIRVRGNLDDGGFFKTSNKVAEWNMFCDPLAADVVFRSGVKIRLIPLDATSKVPIDKGFLESFQKQAHTPLAKFVSQLLEAERGEIQAGYYHAWDPLAAVTLVEPAVSKMTPLAVEIRRKPPEEGRTIEVLGNPNASVALDASASLFRKIYFEAFGSH